MTTKHGLPPGTAHFYLALAAAARQPGLRTVLLLDADIAQLQQTATLLAEMLALSTGAEVDQFMVHAFHQPVDLYGDGLPKGISRKIGLIGDGSGPWRIALIPDLATLSPTMARCILELMEAPQIALPTPTGGWRYGTVRLVWLAACSESNAGAVSRHLLDRFAIRLRPPTKAPASAKDRRAVILNQEPPSWNIRVDQVPFLKMGLSPTRPRPAFDMDLINTLLHRFEGNDLIGNRRIITLARMTHALAWLDGDPQPNRDHLQSAADILGLKQRTPDPEPAAKEKRESQAKTDLTERREAQSKPKDPITQANEPAKSVPKSESTRTREILGSEQEDILSATPLVNPFPEDQAPVAHEYQPLKPLGIIGPRYGNAGGPIIGARPTHKVDELAIMPTLMAALPFQRSRRKGEDDCHIRIFRRDWRAHRRLPQPQHELIFLLDMTALNQVDWIPIATWIFREAYVKRASITLVLVGAADAASEHRAEVIHARSMLSPLIRQCLNRAPGRATPLADGLQRALVRIRTLKNKGRFRLAHIRLVVLSDGRGNIPLNPPSPPMPIRPVGGLGVQDALSVAAELGALNGLERMLLDPQPAYGAWMVDQLAEHLAATVYPCPARKEPS